jgi:membrane associated rhomboid family serine protease
MTKQLFLETYHRSPVTFFIMLVVFFVSTSGLLNRKLFFQFILHPQSITRDKQYYRILTADWTNADFMHLMLNEFMLYVFCSDLEETLRAKAQSGSIQFLIIYLTSLLLGSFIIIVRHRHDFQYSTTGTSGSIMGCMFSFMLLDPNYVLYYLPGGLKITNLYGGLAYILLLILYQKRKKNQTVNHEFHFYGAIGGILATLVLYPGII